MILSEWRLNIHFFLVHCNLLNVDTPKEQFSGPFLINLKNEYRLIHLRCFLTVTETYIHVYHTFKGPQWHNNKPLDNEVLGITNDFLYHSRSMICEKEPPFNETSSQGTNLPVPWHFLLLRFHYNLYGRVRAFCVCLLACKGSVQRGKEQLWNACREVFVFFKATLFFYHQD